MKYTVINCFYLTVREVPEGKAVGWLIRGSKVESDRTEQGWAHITSPKVGWCHLGYLETEQVTQYDTFIDISAWKGYPDWRKVDISPHKFCIFKATEGTDWVDKAYYHNAMWAIHQERLYGAYHYYKNSEHPFPQANNFVRAVMPHIPDFVVLDAEDGSPPVGLLSKAILNWLEIVEKEMGKKPYIYTRATWWNDYIGYVDWAKDYPLWVAHYGATKPLIPQGWDDWTWWQYSVKGKVSGIGTDIDLNYING